MNNQKMLNNQEKTQFSYDFLTISYDFPMISFSFSIGNPTNVRPTSCQLRKHRFTNKSLDICFGIRHADLFVECPITRRLHGAQNQRRINRKSRGIIGKSLGNHWNESVLFGQFCCKSIGIICLKAP